MNETPTKKKRVGPGNLVCATDRVYQIAKNGAWHKVSVAASQSHLPVSKSDIYRPKRIKPNKYSGARPSVA